MNEPRYSAHDPLPPWEARRLPVLMASICLVVYFLSGLSLGREARDAATEAAIITACQAIGWRVLLLFGGPLRGMFGIG
ncbi:hypothetical protein [Paludisphaera sp.]|uniref:hypothetical protein n=1 Tax=Paludisphaera sp. TaxID=2017432 RepID=UPI00301D23CD